METTASLGVAPSEGGTTQGGVVLPSNYPHGHTQRLSTGTGMR